MPNTISNKSRQYDYSLLGRLKYLLVMTAVAILLPFALTSCDVITPNVSDDVEVTEIPVSSDDEDLSDGSVDKSGLPKGVPSDKPLTPPSEVPEELKPRSIEINSNKIRSLAEKAKQLINSEKKAA